MRDLYQALGVSPQADRSVVKKAYRELTRRFHPDRNPGREWATDRYKEIVSAYEVLSDPGKRALYDEFGEVAFTRGFDPERARTARAQDVEAPDRPADSGLWSQDVMDFADLDEVRQTGFDDFLERLFGSWGTRNNHDIDDLSGLDLRASLQLRVSEAITGTTRRVRYPRAGGEWTAAEVTIDPLTVPGSTLRLAGLGEPGEPPGDLLVDIRVVVDDGLRLEGDDIHAQAPVSLRKLYEGGALEVVVPFGRFDVKIPPGTAPHKPLRLRNCGLPSAGGRGDLIVALRAVMPPTGDEPLLAALRRLQKN